MKTPAYNNGISFSPMGNHTPHDTTAVDNCNAIMAVDASGEVVVTDDADKVTTMYCAQGAIYNVGNLKLIKATGTTATNFALFA